MEHFRHRCYPQMHETIRQPRATGEATPAGHSVAAIRRTSVGSGSEAGVFQEFRLPLERCVPDERDPRASSEAHSRSPFPVVPGPEGTLGQDASEGGSGSRIPDRSLDASANRRGDRQAVPRPIPSQPCLETDAGVGLEQPEAGAPGPATGRRRDRALEAVPLAEYKKTPGGWERTWSSSTRVGSSSSRILSGPGLPGDGRRMPDTGTSRATSRPSARCRSLPGSGTWRSTCACRIAASTGWMSGVSCAICCGISGARWSCSGTGGPFTGVGRCRHSWPGIPEFTRNTSRPTLRNSTRRNSSGAKATAAWPTDPRQMWWNCAGRSSPPFVESAAPSSCSGPVSMPRTCRGLTEVSFLYLCEIQ